MKIYFHVFKVKILSMIHKDVLWLDRTQVHYM